MYELLLVIKLIKKEEIYEFEPKIKKVTKWHTLQRQSAKNKAIMSISARSTQTSTADGAGGWYLPVSQSTLSVSIEWDTFQSLETNMYRHALIFDQRALTLSRTAYRASLSAFQLQFHSTWSTASVHTRQYLLKSSR